MKPLKVLLCAYACRPDKGSEPSVGWNVAREMVKYHEVWVLTRTNNSTAIEAELQQHPLSKLHFVYCDLPKWVQWWERDSWEVHIRYYLWQIEAHATALNLHREIGFDLVHHVTYGRYCSPSFLAFLPLPFIWGPVGGGESAPYPFWQDFGFRGRMYERLRDLSRWVGERDPLVQITAKQCAAAIATTSETSTRLKTLGVKQIQMIVGQTGINQEELERLKMLEIRSSEQPIRFLSLGRLLHWKGFHLGIRAFAEAQLNEAEYWIVGEGSQRQILQKLVQDLNISHCVRFFGELPREQALSILGNCDVLVHPSLHDFSPTVCLEAMAAGRPIICFDLGGPSVQITDETGVKIAAHTPKQAVQDMAIAMQLLAHNWEMRVSMGQAGQRRVSEFYQWETKGQFLAQLYEQVTKKDPSCLQLLSHD